MKKRKIWTAILGFSFVCILGINLYLIFFYESPTKRPEHQAPHVAEELQEEQQWIHHTKLEESNSGAEEDITELEEKELEQDSSNIQTGQLPYSEVYVREIPIQLESGMDTHLAEFRRNARLLYQEFPDSFRITMDISKLETSEKAIALTFDDGPDSSSTLEVVNILNQYEIPGTFFLIGQQMDKYPDTIKSILNGGHIIANHSWGHIRPTDVSTEVVIDEADKAQHQIASYNVTTKLYRPPYGLVNRSQMPALIEAGYQVVCWSIDSMDWYFEDPNQIAACVLENAHPGAVVLMHSAGGGANRKATIEALPIIIETLLDEGYHFVGLRE